MFLSKIRKLRDLLMFCMLIFKKKLPFNSLKNKTTIGFVMHVTYFWLPKPEFFAV